MFKSNPFIKKFNIILLLLSGIGVLLFYFEIFNWNFFGIYFNGIFTGFSLGLLISFYYSLATPADWLFQYRYHFEGLFLFLMIGSYGLLKYFFSNDPVNMYEIIIPLIAGSVFGMLWINSAKYKTLKNWRGNFIQSTKKDILFSDAGTFIDSKHSGTKGMIMLTQHEVIFSPSYAENTKIKTDISAMNPQLEKSRVGFLKMPTGVQLTQDRSIQPEKFPRFWVKKIKNIRSEVEGPDDVKRVGDLA